MNFSRSVLPISPEAEMAPFGRHIYFNQAFNQRFIPETIFYKVFNRDELQPELLLNLEKLGQPCHASVVVHDFNQHPSGFKTCQARQVNGSFGMTCAAQHSSG